MSSPFIKSLVLLLVVYGVGLGADKVTIHPRGVELPLSHQGPFISTSDGDVLTIDAKNSLRSSDQGVTWGSTPLFDDPSKYSVSNERALLRTREGVIISAWMNSAERRQPEGWHWGEKEVNWTDFVLPTYICRSLDDGKTWETPLKLSQPWCGCIHSLIEMKSGRVVLVGQEIIFQWRHATVMWVSDDRGASWLRGDVLDYGIGSHDHAGSIEGSIVERHDGSLYLLMRTESGFLWEATSHDGLKWEGLKQTSIPSVTCCPQMARLSNGRIALLWNAPPRHDPKSLSSRVELSLALSEDETKSWSEPVIVAANYITGGRVSYPYLYERAPGELWITTMQGGLRMKIQAAELNAAEIARFVPDPNAIPKSGGIVMFGDSTTAPRAGVEQVYAKRVETALQGIGSSLGVHNAGIPGNTTAAAKKRLQSDVLRYQPRIVVMQFGINDSAIDVWQTPPATKPRVALSTYIENIREMIGECQKQNAKVILMTTNPLRWTNDAKKLYGKPPYDASAKNGFEALNLLAYNAALRKLADETQVKLIDIHAAYPGYAKDHQISIDQMLLDGIHPNDQGQKLVADLLVPAIRDAVR